MAPCCVNTVQYLLFCKESVLDGSKNFPARQLCLLGLQVHRILWSYLVVVLNRYGPASGPQYGVSYIVRCTYIQVSIREA